jgi:DHA2 family methylenomycin A resistance protein-like MFS transporter
VRESADPQSRRLDLAGVVLGGALLAVVTFALIEAGHGGGGGAAVVAAPAAIGLAVAFVLVERSRADAMLPLALFRRPVFSTANAVAGTMNLATLGLLFVVTLYLQDVRGLSPLAAGVTLLPLFLPLTVIAPLAGRVVARTGVRRPMVAGLLLAAVGTARLAVVGPDASSGMLLAALALWGLGLALLTPAVVTAAIGAVPGGRTGLASAVNNTARQAGGALGIAAFGALAGPPGRADFLAGFHAAALTAAGLFAVAAVATIGLIRPPVV